MNKNNGFTLIELIVTVALAAIVIAIAVPSFNSIIQGNRIATQTNELVSTLNLARSEALARGVQVSLCPSTNQTSCSGSDWSGGWIVVTDTNTTGNVNVGTVLRVVGRLNGNSSMAGPTHLRYRPSGGVDATQTFTHQIKGCSGDQARTISVNGAGRVTTSATSCVQQGNDDDQDGGSA